MSTEFTHFASLMIVSAFALWIAAALSAFAFNVVAEDKAFSTIFGVGSAVMLIGAIASWTVVSQLHDILWSAPQPIFFGFAPFANRLDSLSLLFLTLLATVCLAISLYSPGYLEHFRGHTSKGLFWTCMFVFVIAMAQVLLAANAMTFIVFWELMLLSSVALAAMGSAPRRAHRGAIIYLGASRIATGFIIGGFIWIHFITGSWSFRDWALTGMSVCPVLLVLTGLAITAAMFPFHIWLPCVTREAPTPVSALISGVMVNVAIYAIIRLLVLNNCSSPIIAYILIVLGMVSAICGALLALMETDLKRIFAHSTVENIGLIIACIGMTVLCKCTGHPIIALFSFSGVLFHVINHGVFKSLLFLSAGAVGSQAKTSDITDLGGLARTMPWTMTCFFIASVAICALPPLSGFASKWMLYQSFLQMSFRADSLTDRAMSLAIIGILSVVGSLSLATLIKSVGIGFLGRPRSASAAQTIECSYGMVSGQLLLAAVCIMLGLGSGPFLHDVAPICLVGLNYSLDPERLFTIPKMVLSLIGILIVSFVYIVVLGNSHGSRESVACDSGYGELQVRAKETWSSFSQPLRRIFRPLLHYKMETEMQWLSKALVKMQIASVYVHLVFVFLATLILFCSGISL